LQFVSPGRGHSRSPGVREAVFDRKGSGQCVGIMAVRCSCHDRRLGHSLLPALREGRPRGRAGAVGHRGAGRREGDEGGEAAGGGGQGRGVPDGHRGQVPRRRVPVPGEVQDPLDPGRGRGGGARPVPRLPAARVNPFAPPPRGTAVTTSRTDRTEFGRRTRSGRVHGPRKGVGGGVPARPPGPDSAESFGQTPDPSRSAITAPLCPSRRPPGQVSPARRWARSGPPGAPPAATYPATAPGRPARPSARGR
jgi:hypothetical protein